MCAKKIPHDFRTGKVANSNFFFGFRFARVCTGFLEIVQSVERCVRVVFRRRRKINFAYVFALRNGREKSTKCLCASHKPTRVSGGCLVSWSRPLLPFCPDGSRKIKFKV